MRCDRRTTWGVHATNGLYGIVEGLASLHSTTRDREDIFLAWRMQAQGVGGPMETWRIFGGKYVDPSVHASPTLYRSLIIQVHTLQAQQFP
jgi:hypothetical protein